ncbi:MAG TPA: HAD family phosphatase [Verrucomicrobiae bacterium]|nr:HAD family phosphatase [Verrucomicrobiae bacterium]
MKTSLVLFDAAGVLFPANKVVGETVQKEFGLSEEELSEFWHNGLYHELTVGRITTEDLLKAFAKTYNLPQEKVTKELFVGAFTKSLSPMPGIRDLIERLKKTGVKLALLSDTTEMYADIRHELGYYEPFEKLFFSYDIGFRKPDPQAYQAVIDHYGVPASEIFFIDDIAKNVEAAKNQGMRAVVFTGTPQLEKDLAAAGILSSEK